MKEQKKREKLSAYKVLIKEYISKGKRAKYRVEDIIKM